MMIIKEEKYQKSALEEFQEKKKLMYWTCTEINYKIVSDR